MRARFAQITVISSVALAWATGWWGCTSSTVSPLPPLPPAPPGYVQVPHPEGLDVGDLMAIFTDKAAPSPAELKVCDQEYMKLRSMTDSREELIQGAREFVRTDAVRYHWCFYSKLLELEENLQKDTYLDERQNHVLQTYLFVTPFARAFFLEYHDSRYLRWAIARYRRVSEYVFYRRLELSTNAASELAESANPFGLERAPADERRGVLEKYGLVKPEPIPEPSGLPPPTAVLPEKGGAGVPPEAPGTAIPQDVVSSGSAVDTAPTTVPATEPPPENLEPMEVPRAPKVETLPPPAPTGFQKKVEAANQPKAVTTLNNRVPAKQAAIKAKNAPLKTPPPVAATKTASAALPAKEAPLNNEGKGTEAVLDGDNLTTVGE